MRMKLRTGRYMKVIFFSACLLTACSLPFSGNAQNTDINLLQSINARETAFKNGFTDVAAGSVYLVNAAAPLTILTAGIIRKDKKMQLDAAWMAGGYLLSTVITQGTKRIVQRARPYETWPFIIQRTESSPYSFPSGHTSSAFYSATSLSLLCRKWYVVAPAYLWAASVGYARMYQGVHYPSDVLAGAVIGAGSAWAAHYIRQRLEQKKKAAAVPPAVPAL